ncbi:hypothetical protein J6590_003740 [Homalodisca vitripennis]|nr:hypothetical protein J6590_003740 [Homalodisca vitripennis]
MWEWKRFLYMSCRFYDVGSGSGSGTWRVGFTMLGVEAVSARVLNMSYYVVHTEIPRVA